MSEITDKIPADYSADNIQVLEGLEAVRKRPAMYIGDIGIKGLHHLIWEVVDNSIDEAMAGYCNEITVEINEDNSVKVTDNGRGIPTGMHSKMGKSALEVVMTVLHAGGKFDKDTYKVSGGLHGVGVSCVNALSSHLTVTVNSREGKVFRQEYKKGIPQYDVKEIGTTDIHGTTVHFLPDSSIFTESVYKYETVAARLRELSFLNKGIKINFKDHREVGEDGLSIGAGATTDITGNDLPCLSRSIRASRRTLPGRTAGQRNFDAANSDAGQPAAGRSPSRWGNKSLSML